MDSLSLTSGVLEDSPLNEFRCSAKSAVSLPEEEESGEMAGHALVSTERGESSTARE